MNKITAALIVALAISSGCDFEVNPPNEGTETVRDAYFREFNKEMSEDDYTCMRTFQVHYVDSLDQPGWAGYTAIGPTTRDIYVIGIDGGRSQLDVEIDLTHEYVHAYLWCSGDSSDIGTDNHTDPRFWTCTDSVEEYAAEIYGGHALNTTYNTVCTPETRPSNYNPRH